MKKAILIIVVGLVSNVSYAQGLTLGGLGAGGLDGSGFGDPVANDYAGIDWGYDFQTGMIINGYNPQQARVFANQMAARNAYRYRPTRPSATRKQRKRQQNYRDYRMTGLDSIMSFEQYEAMLAAPY